MAYVWVQQWIPLPVVFEEHMGDAPDANAQPHDHSRFRSNQPPLGFGTMSPEHPEGPRSADQRSPDNAPFYAHYSSMQSQPRPDNPRMPSAQGDVYGPNAPGRDGAGAFQMGAMSAALPEYGTSPGHQPQQTFTSQAGISGPSQAAFAFQMQQPGQFQNQSTQPYAYQNSSQYASAQGQYGPAHNFRAPFNAQRSAGPSPTTQNFPSHYMYYPGNFTGYPQAGGFMGGDAQGIAQQNRRANLPYPPMPGQLQTGVAGQSMPSAGYSPMGPAFPIAAQFANRAYSGDQSRQTTDLGLSSPISRGPPRKPKQSGHALWVGNLPPGTTITDLKDHFSRDATKDIESLFLISKSNCAFVNYKTEESCTAAMHRFHDSRFQGVRLVCRLRRSSATVSGVPSAPAAMTGGQQPPRSTTSEAGIEEEATPSENENVQQREDAIAEGGDERVPEKFFVLKSLTLQDLEASVRNGIWATQAHNEKTLNRAFETADTVYLIFSANKSGEYFGYARMISPISEDAADVASVASSMPQAQPSPSVSDLNISAPKAIPTAPTEHAPKGRIIDDSARGTIFWEAERSDSEPDESPNATNVQLKGELLSPGSGPGAAQEWGKPFRLEWLSTNRLPFYRTRGLRNPWNANREVKIARDGTELETSVGRRLVSMFHRPNGPVQGVQGIQGGLPNPTGAMMPVGAGLQQQMGLSQNPAIVGNMPAMGGNMRQQPGVEGPY